jgi:phosphotransferase system  glucose/maltose/N-acetylglucosamine-specific IIC component
MKAKTQSDLAGLFTDLPPVDVPGKAVKAVPPQDQRPRNRRPLHRTLGLILVIVVAVIVARALTWPLFSLLGFFGHAVFVPIPWILIALVAFLCWRYVVRRRDRGW